MTAPDRYPTAELKHSVLDAWEGDDYAMLRYHAKWRTGGISDVGSRLLLDFKGRDVAAARLMEALAIAALRRHEAEFRDRRNCRYLVALPGHQAGPPTGPCQALATRIAAEIEWLTLLPGLTRRTPVAKSAWAAPGERPDREQHRASMSYDGPIVSDRRESIIMLDDVITAGATSAAAREVLIETTRCRSVVGFFLSRTMNP